MTQVFKKMEVQSEKKFSVKQMADLTGPVKMLLFENYRNEYESKPYRIQGGSKDFERLIDRTMEGNKTAKALKTEIEEDGFNFYEKTFTAMDLVEVFKCGPQSKAIEGLRTIYKRDTHFIRALDAISNIYKNVHNYSDENAFLNALNEYKDKYFVVIGGNTRMSILCKMYKENKEAANQDGSAKLKYTFAIIDYNRVMKKVNCDMANYYGASQEVIDLYHKLHYAALRLLIYKDNERERSNMSDGATLTGLAVIARSLAECQRFFTKEEHSNMYLRDLESYTKSLWGMVSSLGSNWMLQSIAYDLACTAQNALIEAAKSEGKNYKKRIYTSDELENYAKVLITTVGAKTSTIDDEKLTLESRKIEEFCGIDLRTLEIKDHKTFWEVVELTTLLKEQKKDSPASYLSKNIKKIFLSRKEDESWSLTKEEREDLVDKVNNYTKNNCFDEDATREILSFLIEMQNSANNFGIISVSKHLIDELLTKGNASKVLNRRGK